MKLTICSQFERLLIVDEKVEGRDSSALLGGQSRGRRIRNVTCEEFRQEAV